MWMQDGCKVYMHSHMVLKWIMFHSHLDYIQKPHLRDRPNTKLGDHDTLNAHNRWFIQFYYVQEPAWIDIHRNSIWLRSWSHMTSHYTWGSWPHYYMILEVYWDGLWTLSFGLSQFHGHGPWLVCEVALLTWCNFMVHDVSSALRANNRITNIYIFCELFPPFSKDQI